MAVLNAYTADYYWTNNSSNNWNDNGNWVDAMGIPIGSTPGASDVVYFNNSNNSNCNIDIDVNIGGLILDGYTGTININGYNFQVSSGDCTFNSGTITGGTLTINTTGTVTFAGTTFGATVNSVSGRLRLNGSTFNAEVTLEKNGSNNDACSGGNIFNAAVSIINSGSGYLRLQDGSSDTFNSNVRIENSGTSYLLFATNSAGNSISGDFSVINSGNDNSYIEVCYNSASTLDISGNCTIKNIGTGNRSRNYFALNGTINIGGNLILNNNSTANNSYIYLSYYSGTNLNITGTTTIYNEGSSDVSCIYLGYNGDITFNDTVITHNNSSANSSRVYFALRNDSYVLFNEDIIIESTDANCDGVSFGENGGTSALASNKQVKIGNNGFVAGDLRFRNFKQNSNTSQNINCTGSARILNIDSYWQGSVHFVAPRIYTAGTIYEQTAYLEKTGSGNDASIGGNIFEKDLEIKHTGTGYFLFGRQKPDTCKENLTINNQSSYYVYFAHNSSKNYIAGNLTANNIGSTGNNSIIFCSYDTASLTIDGKVILYNNAGSDRGSIYFGNRGTITCNNVVYVSNNGAGTTKQIYLSSNAKIIFNDSLKITNNSSATNSRIYLNRYSSAENIYNGHIILESTNANSDGITFGESNGKATLSSGKTISIGPLGYVAGDIEFRNFTQTGNTPQSLTCTGTARIYNYDSYWGGDISFIAPRIITRGTTYNKTVYLEKNGALNDGSAGGNIFKQNTELKNSGSGYFLMGSNMPDTCLANLTLNNESTDNNLFFAYNSPGNYISGNLSINNIGTGTHNAITICSYDTSTLVINGRINIINNSSADNSYVNFGNKGQITCNSVVKAYNYGVNNTSEIYLGYRAGTISFNDSLYLINNSTANYSNIYLNRFALSHNYYNGNIVVECTGISSDGIRFGNNGGQGELISGKNISISTNGFSSGQLLFRNFTQHGNTPQTLACTGNAIIYNYDSDWGGDIHFSAPRIYTRGTLYRRTAYLEKTGSGNDGSYGGNIFTLNAEIKNSGSGYFLMGNNIADTCLSNLTINNEGASIIYFAHNSTGNLINGNLYINNNSTADRSYIYLATNTVATLTVNGNTEIFNHGSGTYKRIYIGNNGDIIFNGTVFANNNSNATNSLIYFNDRVNSHNIYNDNIILESTDSLSDGIRFGGGNGSGELASGKTVNIGTNGFFSGQLLFRNFTQHGNTSQTLNCTGDAYIYNYDSDWGGDIHFSAPGIYTRGTLYRKTTYLEKTGSGNNSSAGGNIFTLNTELKNSGSGYFLMSSSSPDTCLADLLMNNTGTNRMYFAYGTSGNYIAGKLTINNTYGTSVNICNNNSSSLKIDGITKLYNDSVSDYGEIVLGYRGSILCNDSVNVYNIGGGNTKRIYLGAYANIIFNKPVYLQNNSNAGAAYIYSNRYSSSHNIFNDNIIIECPIANSDGIRFGESGGSCELANGKTITIGTNGFISGRLMLRNFTQNGNTAQTLVCTGTSDIYNYDSDWGGDVHFVAPRIYTRGTLYNGTAYLEKTGSGYDYSYGGNTFQNEASIINSGSGRIYLARNVADDFNSNANFILTGTGILYPTYNAASTFAGNININTNKSMYFGATTNGRVVFDGTSAQSVNNLGSQQTITFRDLQTNNPNDEITLNTPITVSVELDLDQGNINTSDTTLLTMRDNSTVSSVSDDAYVRGPIEKIGNDAFTFPVGDSSMYRPISISAPSSSSARFRATYNKENPWNYWSGGIGTRDATIDHISSKEYWILNRTNTSNSVNVTLSWRNPESGGVTNLSDLVVARWNGTKWKDHGNGGTTGDVNAGTVVTAAPVTSFSPFTLASRTTENPLPVTWFDFEAVLNNNQVNLQWSTHTEINNDYFIVEKSQDGINFEYLDKINGAGNSNNIINYSTIDYTPYKGVNYYRIKQVDFDGKFSYSTIRTVNYNANNLSNKTSIKLYPNPAISSNNVKIELQGFESDKEVLVVVQNILGEQMYSKIILLDDNGFALEGIDPNNRLSKGTYIIVASSDDNLLSKKLIILE